NIALGAYSFGKALRAVKLIRESGYSGDIGMEPVSLALTEGLMDNAGQLVDVNSDCGIRIVTPAQIPALSGTKKFILTGRKDYKIPTINISDHMDVNELVGMVEGCNPEAVIVYHPGGHRPYKLAGHLNKMGTYARALGEINTVLEI
ncbi:MAG: MBL fold metallo-hydrolase, partial [Candidatus Methanoperedens sp.]